MKITKILTENPLLDEIVYNCKIMALGTVLKDEAEADSYETLDSLKASDLYIGCYENKVKFLDFTYDAEFLSKYIVDSVLLSECINDNSKIPDKYRTAMLEAKKSVYLSDYIETNNYYRKLNGLPDYETTGLKVSHLSRNPLSVDANTYIHKLSSSDIEILENQGLITELMTNYPKMYYLKYLGAKKIDIYKARRASKFGALYIPMPTSYDVYNRYVANIEINIAYNLKTIYNEAYKFMSDYYDKFIMILIIVQTFVDCVSELPEYIVRGDIFDIRTIRYIFESNGIDYFREIPIKYQIKMAKNINMLIKYKSSTKGLVDICSLFGFDNIEIFKYYLLKDRRLDENGKYVYETTTDVDGNVIEDVEQNFTLKFLKVPIDDIPDNYAKTDGETYSYDTMTALDKYWDGPYSHDYVKKKILEREFNLELSKYISINTLYDLTEMSFEMPYFMNMLMFNNNINKENLNIPVPILSGTNKFNIVDLFIYLYALMYLYLGSSDNIMNTNSKVMYIKGFNFQVDLPQLNDWLLERGETLASLGVEGFVYGNNTVLTFPQLLNIYVKNKEVEKIARNGMNKANNKREYDLYKKIYESFFITQLNYDYYNIPADPELANKYTYTDFLSTKNKILYNNIMEFKAIEKEETRREKIATMINSVVSVIQEALNTDLLDNIYHNLPTISVDYIKTYMYRVINFFKSYKIHIIDINTIYRFDTDLDNRITMIDQIAEMIHTHEYIDNMAIFDKAIKITNLTKESVVELKERLYKVSESIRNIGSPDFIDIYDKLCSIMISINKVDNTNIREYMERIATIIKTDLVPVYDDILYYFATFGFKENVNISNDYISEIYRWFFRLNTENINIKENPIFLISITKSDNTNIRDGIYEKNYVYNKIENLYINDRFKNITTILEKIDKYNIIDDCYITRTYE